MGSMMLPKYKGSASSIPADGELPPDIAKYGYLRKLKTMKKKYIVLRLDSDAGPARLEYYDSEKKCRNGQAPKRSIVLKNCFNINRKMDSKHKFALALYTRDDCFALVAETEHEMDAWLGALLKLQQGEASWDGDPQPKPNFEHVWQVNVKNKGLASTSNIIGQHHLCLTSHTLSLVKMNSDKDNPLKFPLISIRRCGHSDCFFFMELGRSAVTGCGELWMATEDNIIAQNMHETILGAMVSSRKCHEELGPINRPRSASTSDNNSKGAGSSTPRAVAVVTPLLTPGSSAGSLKDTPFRSRTVSEGHHDLRAMRENLIDPLRPHSTTYTHSISYSPPMTSKPLSPGSSAYSDSAGSSHSIDDYENEYHPNRIYPYPQEGSLHTEPTITEESSDDYLTMSPGEFDPLDQMMYEMSGGSSVENPSLDYMQMSYTGNHSYPANRHSGMDSSNRKPMYLSLTAQQPDSCPTSPTTDYIEMASPSSSSIHQDSAGEGYIPMSPVGSLIVDLNHGSTNKRMPASMVSIDGGSNGHIGGQPSETYSGYVPMAPVRENEGYMEMSALSSSLPKSTVGAGPTVGRNSHVELSTPSQSSHSLQDVSFGSSTTSVMEEYHLDKVKSFFSPSEDDGEVYIKPARAYSIGSRPQVQKSHLAAHLETSRVRAYSFGSQASSRRRETSNYGGIEAELGTLRNIDARNNKKSSSAPLLQSGPLQTPTSTTMPPLPNPVNSRGNRSSGNRSSGGGGTSHNDDLMEIVYHQPPYMRMKPDDHANRRYTMNSHWQRSNNRPGHDSKSNGKEDRRSQISSEVVDQADGFNMSKRNDSDYMDVSRSNSKSGSSWEEPQSDPHRSLQGSSGKRSSRKAEGNDSIDSSRGSYQLPAGSKGPPNESQTKKSEEVDVLGPKKSSKGHSKKPSKQISECSDYMEMGRGNPVPVLRHSSYSLDASSISQQENSSSSAGDYVNLDISCRQPETVSSKAANAEFPSVVHNVDTQPHDYMNLQLGASTPAGEIDLVVSEAASRLPDNPQAKTNTCSTKIPPSCISVQPQLTKQNSTSGSDKLLGTRKSSCPIFTANNTERAIRHSSLSPERATVVSETELAGNRRSLVEGPYENIQLGSSLHLSVERQLNYASLDLDPPSSAEDVPRSPRSSKEPGTDVEVPLSYAEIDFTKSEGLRNTSGNFREGRV